MTRRLTIRTERINPPIPTRDHDWRAVIEPYELHDPIGSGSNEAEAVMDLYYQIELREADDSDRYEYETRGEW